MGKTSSSRRPRSGKSDSQPNPFQERQTKKSTSKSDELLHSLGDGIVCDTDRRGYSTPQGATPAEIVVDASEGFIPLWARNTTLRWRFRESSLQYFANPTAAETEIRKLFAEAILAWGSAAPVTFREDHNVWDFELVMRSSDDCNPGGGCVLASAFFPDSGRHELTMYPKMFTQAHKEQVDTFIHEIGHIFGLRHFFANVSESAWPSEIFGTHSKFSIMNYGALSELATSDKDDLRRLYQLAWAGVLTNINGTPIRFVKPYHILAYVDDGLTGPGMVPSPFLPRSAVSESPVPMNEIASAMLPRTRASYLSDL